MTTHGDAVLQLRQRPDILNGHGDELDRIIIKHMKLLAGRLHRRSKFAAQTNKQVSYDQQEKGRGRALLLSGHRVQIKLVGPNRPHVVVFVVSVDSSTFVSAISFYGSSPNSTDPLHDSVPDRHAADNVFKACKHDQINAGQFQYPVHPGSEYRPVNQTIKMMK